MKGKAFYGRDTSDDVHGGDTVLGDGLSCPVCDGEMHSYGKRIDIESKFEPSSGFSVNFQTETQVWRCRNCDYQEPPRG